VLELEAWTLATEGVDVELGAIVAAGVVLGAAVIVEETAADDEEKDDEEVLELPDLTETLEDELALEDDTDADEEDEEEKLELEEEAEYEVLEAVVGSTKFPAVTVNICAPIADASLNVVVEDVAVLVIVPRIAFTDLLHVP